MAIGWGASEFGTVLITAAGVTAGLYLAREQTYELIGAIQNSTPYIAEITLPSYEGLQVVLQAMCGTLLVTGSIAKLAGFVTIFRRPR